MWITTTATKPSAVATTSQLLPTINGVFGNNFNGHMCSPNKIDGVSHAACARPVYALMCLPPLVCLLFKFVWNHILFRGRMHSKCPFVLLLFFCPNFASYIFFGHRKFSALLQFFFFARSNFQLNFAYVGLSDEFLCFVFSIIWKCIQIFWMLCNVCDSSSLFGFM